MFRVIITTGSHLTDGEPETQRVISRHRSLQTAERALAAFRRDSPIEGLRAIIVSEWLSHDVFPGTLQK